MTEVVKEGDVLRLHYRLTLEDGFPVDATEPGEPLEFVLGDGTLAPVLEGRLLGMRVGDSAVWDMPEDCFGEPDPAQVRLMPRADFPADMELEKGSIIAFELPNGEQAAGTVMDGEGDEVLVDFNHPLTGRAFRFEVSLLAIIHRS